MRFAAIADIHGNIDALEAVLADIAALGIAEVVNLGDHVSGPLEPLRTAELLMARGFPSIQGDQDRKLVEKRAALRRPFTWLGDAYLECLAAMPATLLYRDDVLLCHGSPRSDEAYWLDHVTDEGMIMATQIEDIERDAAGIAASLILCGHTHLPRVVRLRDGRLVVNAGSVGLPGYRGCAPVAHVVESGTPDACYAILERTAGRWMAGIRYVPYDATRMAELAARAGCCDWASALATGWVSRMAQ
ncbi:MAG TPA: metallophosphoesterase family protein [Hyphomicrobiaceae bacterium]|nr:metallophosphoesterase family protein [Hyphomicrobiaceae bacterium]